MNEYIPLITAIAILGIITLLFFVNEFFRKYKVVKKMNPRKRKVYPKPRKLTDYELEEIITNAKLAQKHFRAQQSEKHFYDDKRALLAFSKWYDEKHKNVIKSWQSIAK